MVSFWPFKSSEDQAYFEKTLSTLSGKIIRAASRNDAARQRSRRIRVMWTLWAGFAYIFAALFWSLVVGYQNWGRTEYTAVVGGPVLIYIVRTTTTRYYDWRISSTEAYIKTLTKEREVTIERLKESTKWNSTQQLLEKYGGQTKQKNPNASSDKKKDGPQKPTSAPGPRTGIAPPPTANIQRPSDQRPATPQQPAAAAPPQGRGSSPAPALPPPESLTAEFAPNAFSAPELTRQYTASTASFTQSHWYDRILDALLGEDETQPKNRLALICSECRLVNGQAPPGARTLDDVGRWRCGGCHAWNGKEKVEEVGVERLVQEWEEERKAREFATDGADKTEKKEMEEAVGEDEGSGVDVAEESVDEAPAVGERTTRSKSKAKGK
ncbi:uncharacterized protein N0V89_008373 [Didymosphaeria variabile]|uniref:Endoplasmic reticulum junction formation protein lunapark n=1 Tax=Didymosphaeria variabile TaxID=1932322 RepID=A0A9W8XFU4_9PLEO|nr:uncharacterized protein N0V89_008373 [Didymosphaeria variabile]KAJ4349755.1 hypothetical protein N0V89_008373 [Didymosphaeria variabile]